MTSNGGTSMGMWVPLSFIRKLYLYFCMRN